MKAEAWEALGTMLLGVGALFGGIWALYNYHVSRRTETSQWLQGIFKDFYLADSFRDVRLVLEYQFAERAGPLLERRITDRHLPLTDDDVSILAKLDILLNYFEHVLYLEEQRQIRTSDRLAVFEYWFDIMSADDASGLRRYVARFGFERVARVLNAKNQDLLAVYGSLRKGFGLPDLPSGLDEQLVDAGPCIIRGDLFDLGDYPGMKHGQGIITGELFQIQHPDAFALLDKYERFDPSDPEGSLFVRRCIRLVQPNIDAWVYLYNEEVSESSRVASGDWVAYLDNKG